MNISYLEPLSRGWTRMKWILFSPFDITKWLVVGFTAWLVELTDTFSWGGNSGPKVRREIDWHDWDDFATDTVETVQDVMTYALGSALIMFLIGVAIILYLVMLWLSSRGAFMFLDNIVHNRAEVKAPWRQFAGLGDSLFVWRLVFGIICLLAFGPLIALIVIVSLPMIMHEAGAAISIPGYVILGGLVLVFAVVAAYVDFFLMHCVVPIMYKHQLKAMDGWRKFMPLLRRELGAFVVFGLFYVLLMICFGVAVVLLGLVTCCIGWLILAIPYLGSVLLLPVHVTFRGLDLEFLAQFGKDYDVVEEFATPQ
jgi:hypothetical protein